MSTILIVEDELAIRSFVSLNLKKKAYKILEADSGEKALDTFKKNQVDIVLLDIMLPGMDGYTVCQELRESNQGVGIIMLTARTQEEDKVKGLLAGADDYIAKPFSMTELEARIISLLRRMNSYVNIPFPKRFQSGPFILDLAQITFTCHEQDIKLTPTEFYLLQFLISNKNQTFTRDNLLDEVWGVNYVGDIKVVDVNIRRIRTKIERDSSNPEYLLTVWGHGYMWRE
jgi:DNA-binding response OmpR family regulator